jgi:hypothetical protein
MSNKANFTVATMDGHRHRQEGVPCRRPRPARRDRVIIGTRNNQSVADDGGVLSLPGRAPATVSLLLQLHWRTAPGTWRRRTCAETKRAFPFPGQPSWPAVTSVNYPTLS